MILAAIAIFWGVYIVGYQMGGDARERQINKELSRRIAQMHKLRDALKRIKQ